MNTYTTQESIAAAYVSGEIDRPEWMALSAAYHATLGHCICNCCTEVRAARVEASDARLDARREELIAQRRRVARSVARGTYGPDGIAHLANLNAEIRLLTTETVR